MSNVVYLPLKQLILCPSYAPLGGKSGLLCQVLPFENTQRSQVSATGPEPDTGDTSRQNLQLRGAFSGAFWTSAGL